MLIEDGNNYKIKMKLHGTIYTVDLLITKNVWTFVSLRIAYPGSVRELGRIMFDVIINT